MCVCNTHAIWIPFCYTWLHLYYHAVVHCGPPDVPRYGAVTTPNGVSFGARAQYSCNTEFELQGSKFHTCQENGEWSPEAPICKRRRKVCSAGHSLLIKYHVVLCKSCIVWSHNQHECLVYATVILPPLYMHSHIHYVCKHAAKPVECDELGAPHKGQVVLEGRSPGSKATYSCRPGYQLVGNPTRKCQNNGRWSGSTPFCRSKTIKTKMLNLCNFIPMSEYPLHTWKALTSLSIPPSPSHTHSY